MDYFIFDIMNCIKMVNFRKIMILISVCIFCSK